VNAPKPPLTDERLQQLAYDEYVCSNDNERAMAVELLAARAQLARVREVHEPIEAVNMRYPGGRLTQVCSGCGTDDGNWQIYPCPTIRALREVQ
jgi:hypothetical protein